MACTKQTARKGNKGLPKATQGGKGHGSGSGSGSGVAVMETEKEMFLGVGL